jgi:signal transduction histidine kinase
VTGKVRSGRLLWRIYGAGVLQAVLATAVVYVAIRSSDQPMQPLLDSHARFVAHGLAHDWEDDGRVFAQAEDAARILGAAVTLMDSSAQPRFSVGEIPTSWFRKPMVATVPVMRGGNVLGLVRVATYYEPAWYIPLLFWCGVLLFAGMGAMLITRSMVRTIEDMAQAAHALGQGDLRARANVHRRDELGQLAETFNLMASRLERTLGAQSELLANVSHELRTPLARMRVALDLAEEGSPLDGQDLMHISEDLTELETLVSEIITTARLDVQQGRANGVLANLQTQNVSLRELVNASAQRFASRHPGRTLDVVLPAEGARVQASSALLRRAVDNLLENAVRYSETDTAIALRASSADARAVIEVVDRGVGMTPEDLARAFEPFYRSDRSRTRASGGLGLGLTLTQRIVEAHGGQVALESAQGVGTTARVRIPLA